MADELGREFSSPATASILRSGVIFSTVCNATTPRLNSGGYL